MIQLDATNPGATEAATVELAKEELRSIQASGIFERSGGLWILLDYVCNKYFEGQSEQLKEYTIAVEAFGRPPEFDKKRDSIVRVEAHRLRKRLDRYYQDEGANRPVRIVIPPGQYAPRFSLRPESIAAVASPTPRRGNSLIRWMAVAAVLLAASVGLAYLYIPHMDKQWRGTVVAANPLPSAGISVPGEVVRIAAGSRSGNNLDSMGRTWSADEFFTDGDQVTIPFRTLFRTKDPTIYLKRRMGNFRYDIPLKSGVYEMRLFFAETNYGDGNLEGGGETSRLFRVTANGKVLLDDFDVILDAAGPNTADVRVFKQITPDSDGFLHLRFQSQKERAFINAIELVPGDAQKLLPIRFVARETGYTDTRGQAWMPESYVLGGRLVLRQDEVTGTPDPGLFQSERYGNFNYAIPVAPGRYTVILHFAETWHGPHRGNGSGPGSRVFDVFCNGVALLQSFDIFKEAGRSFKAVEKRFTGLQANAQGKLILSFVPQRNYANVSAIEVLDQGN
jgi:hypothetical protein